MTPERWRQINDLFHAVVERDHSARDEALDQTARTDPALAAEVRSLLAVHDSGESPVDQPVWAAAPGLILDDGRDDRVLQPGTVMGPYRVVRELGRGGMGVVYEAEDTRLRRVVALKALPAEYASDPHRRERLTREARAAAALTHPSIATIFALDELDGALYLVAELVRGSTLREELRRGPLPAAVLRRTLVELASGLAAAHKAGIVHRDFKPENIVRCEDGGLKILDFGIARMADDEGVTELRLTETGMAIGTPGYMAPEQLAGQPVDARADVFAFGVVAWELATGVHPFGATTADLLARMTDMMQGRPVTALGAALPIPGLEAILRRCLRSSPAERHDSAVEILAALEQLGGPTAASSPALPRQTGERDALWWWQAHQLTVAVVVAAMPVACWFVRRWNAPVGSALFLIVLALSTIAVTIRLNLFFTSRVRAGHLAAHHGRVHKPLVVVEAMLGLLLLGGAALVVGDHDALAAVLVTLAVATVASLGLVEPGTTSAALAGGNGADPE